MYEIYLITNTINGKKYVGQTSRSIKWRWGQHKYQVSKGSSLPFHRAIRKHGPDMFTVEQIDKCDSQEEANLSESKHILFHKSNVYGIGYNCDEGGDVRTTSEETKRKIGEKLKARWAANPELWENRELSEEGRENMRKAAQKRAELYPSAMKGKLHSEESRKKMAVSQRIRNERGDHPRGFLGKKHSLETLEKMKSWERPPCSEQAKTAIGYANSRKDLDNKQITNLYLSGSSAEEVAKTLGTSHSTVLRRLKKEKVKIRLSASENSIFLKKKRLEETFDEDVCTPGLAVSPTETYF